MNIKKHGAKPRAFLVLWLYEERFISLETS